MYIHQEQKWKIQKVKNSFTKRPPGKYTMNLTRRMANLAIGQKPLSRNSRLKGTIFRISTDRWGAENIIGFDVHLDETTPHIHIQTIPVARTKARGRASIKYVHKDDKSKTLSQKEWKKLPEEIRGDFVRTEVERREKECVSYARVWGEDKYAVGRTYYQMHTDYYNEVGHKYGLERGDNISMLPSEERRERVHKNKVVLEAERQAKTAIDNAKAEKQ